MLQPDRFYTWEEMLDRQIRVMYGDDTGLEWLKERGTTLKHKSWISEVADRTPVYGGILMNKETSKAKGIGSFNSLVPVGPEYIDFTSGAFEPVPRVKVKKV